MIAVAMFGYLGADDQLHYEDEGLLTRCWADDPEYVECDCAICQEDGDQEPHPRCNKPIERPLGLCAACYTRIVGGHADT